MKKTKNTQSKAFTLVELIVVVTILAILATIGFVSYSSYLTGVRDTNRLAQLVSIHDGLTLYSAQKDLPLPDNNVEIKAKVSSLEYTIGYQGEAGANTLETIDFTKGGKDPRDGEYFSYMLTENRKGFQLMAMLEEDQSLQSYSISGVNAADYSSRVVTVYGNSLGILTNEENLPVQEISGVITDGKIIFDGTGSEYTAHLSDNTSITSNGSEVLYGAYVEIAGKSNTSCKELLSKFPYVEGTDGAFWINVGQETLKLPCDMTTDGGGWTLTLHGTSEDIAKYDANGNDTWKLSSTSIGYTSVDKTFKFTDDTIASIRDSGSYMLVGENADGDPQSTVFIPSSCSYDHELGNQTECSTLYSDVSHSTVGCTGGDANQKGIGCFSTNDVPRFILNNGSLSGVNAVCYMIYNGGCTGSTTNGISVKMYVR